MLKAVADVRDEILRRCGGGEITLETITEVFAAISVIDQIVFVRYETSPTNPIWGEFARWSQQPKVYAPSETMVEIRYASHLTEPWQRLIVCKELCHALDVANGNHDVSRSSMESLVSTFSLRSHAEIIPKARGAFQLELLAEVGAVELLCPKQRRMPMIAQGRKATTTEEITSLAAHFNMPEGYVAMAFDQNYINAIEALIA